MISQTATAEKFSGPRPLYVKTSSSKLSDNSTGYSQERCLLDAGPRRMHDVLFSSNPDFLDVHHQSSEMIGSQKP